MTKHKRAVKEIKYVVKHIGNSGRIYLRKASMRCVRTTLINHHKRGNVK
jgi:hypothetical protein